jgi:beta-mannosidase
MEKYELNLAGQWQFKEYPPFARRMRDLDDEAWHETVIPCSIFHSLIDAGKITQADIDSDPEKLAWVSEKSWVYSKTFDVPAELLTCDRIDLVFEGLDTVATVWLNERPVGKTNNMFISHRFNVSSLAKPKGNRLLVKFDSARAYAQKLMQRYGVFIEEQFGNPFRVYVRKAQYQFGWDFCPSLDGCGIWRPCRLEGINKARLEDVHIRTIDANQHYADIRIAVKLDTVAESEFTCRLRLHGGALNLAHEMNFKKGRDFQSALMRIDRPFLWWPRGYGVQHLYKLDTELLAGNELIDRRSHNVGVRTIKLIRSDAAGPTFQFEVNGQPIHIKGANWVPATPTPGRLTAVDYEHLLKMASKANINMLRVWGGGYYENPEFYEICDRLGILVWQDFMFACAYYPDRQWFLDEVKKEADMIIKRLRNYACFALWCGNNEIDWLHRTGAFGKSKKFYGKDIYHKLLPQIVDELDPGRDYIPSTPFFDTTDLSHPLTTHQWKVWSGHSPMRDYLNPSNDVESFVTEFGFASAPCIETLKSFVHADSLHICSQQIEKHNYQLDGNSRLFRYMSDIFGAAKDLDDFVYKTQLTQARAAKSYVEYLRAHKSKNHGILFWQFNDCCAAISWSAIDYRRRLKALYYYARRFFAPLLITAVPHYDKRKHFSEPDLSSLSLAAVNDTPNPVTASIIAKLLNLEGNILDQTSLPAVISPHSVSTPLKLSRNFVSPPDPSGSLLHMALEKDGKLLAENIFLYAPDKYINWPDPQIQFKLHRKDENLWKLILSCRKPAKDVRIHLAAEAILSDNFFDMLPNREYELTVICDYDLAVLSTPVRFCFVTLIVL